VVSNIQTEQIKIKQEQVAKIDKQLKDLNEWLRIGYGPDGDSTEILQSITRLQGEKVQVEGEIAKIRESAILESNAKVLLEEISNPAVLADVNQITRWATQIKSLSSINQQAALTELRIRLKDVVASDPNALGQLEQMGVDKEIWGSFDKRQSRETMEKEDKAEASNERLAYVQALVVGMSDTELDNIRQVAEFVASDKVATDALITKIDLYYRSLTSGTARWEFVNRARQAQVSENIIGEHLWQKTREVLENNAATMDEAREIMKEVLGGEMYQTNMEPDVLWEGYVLPRFRERLPIGLSREAEAKLEMEFYESVNGLRDQNNLKINISSYTEGITDAVVTQFTEQLGLHDPAAKGRSTALNNYIFVRRGRVDYGAIEKAAVEMLSNDPSIEAGTPKFDELAMNIAEAASKNLDGELKDINELQKKVRELTLATKKLKRMETERRWNMVSGGLKAGGSFLLAGAMVTSGWAFLGLPGVSQWTNTGKIMGGGVSALGIGALLPRIKEAYLKNQDLKEKIGGQIEDVNYLKTEVARMEAKTGYERVGRKKKTRNWFEEQIRGMGPEILDTKVQEFIRNGSKPLKLGTM